MAIYTVMVLMYYKYIERKPTLMAQQLWNVKVSYGCGGNIEMQVTAPTQSMARKIAENQTGYKCVYAQPAR